MMSSATHNPISSGNRAGAVLEQEQAVDDETNIVQIDEHILAKARTMTQLSSRKRKLNH